MDAHTSGGMGPKTSEGVGKPFLPQANVVINGAFDRLDSSKRIRSANASNSPWPRASEEQHVVKRHDLLFKYRNQMSGMTVNTLGDPPLKMFGSANGIIMNQTEQKFKSDYDRSQNPACIEEIRNSLRRRIKWVGVALPGHDAREGDNQSVGMAVCVGGTQTIINTGPKRINAFDTVVWDVPTMSFERTRGGGDRTVTAYGAPPDKATFETKSYSRDEMMNGARMLLQRLPNTIDDVSSEPGGDEAVIGKCMKSLITSMLDEDKLTRAFGSAKSPEEFKKMIVNMQKEVYAKIVTNAAEESANRSEKPSIVNTLMKIAELAFGYKLNLDSRIIGTALSSANAGEPLNLYLSRAPGV